MPNVTVADTSCPILFYKIGELELLKKLFGTIQFTEAISKEFNRATPDWVKIVNPSSKIDKGLSSYLDTGEATTIALAADFIDRIKKQKRSIVLTQHGKSAAVLVDVSEYQRMIDKLDLMEELIEKTDQLIDHPESGRMVPECNEPNLQEIIHGNYRVICRIRSEENAVYIQTVWHVRQLPPKSSKGLR